MSKERQAKEAAQTFRLLRAFRSIRDRAVRRHVIEAVEAMADRREAPDDKADTVNIADNQDRATIRPERGHEGEQ
ncbi:hypothetical protein [Bradyrhizobium elkanii]|uniref:hypothetical protein n=1 Tax=Bradyrhizobium elkanii TaxID=29448 RepID=UPI0035149396